MSGKLTWPATRDKDKLREMLAQAAATTALLPIRGESRKNQKSPTSGASSGKEPNARRGR